MNEINDGGPAFTCTKCGIAFEPREWQVKSRDRRCLPCKVAVAVRAVTVLVLLLAVWAVGNE
ncbi:hypothetical protein [Burkholderia multivorans]|uniref:hypothetical protein n=1 Tax=Burkholderia multivorans TaxID=87883 RepID=UPI0019D28E90|nr:hypothetical protein [Burkholderia multivorans]MBN6728759.1 hypothetical protein [Burkholderia multivorans]MBN6728762.1 hypothetical protein [Burkholderia multivorans]